MFLSAYVKDQKTGQHILIERDYPTKDAFRRDLKGNGYTVIRISNKRDLYVQEYYGAETYSTWRKDKMYWINKYPETFGADLAKVEEVDAIEL